MTTGKHIGKVIIDMRGENASSVPPDVPLMIEALPRFYCAPNKTYIIIGNKRTFEIILNIFIGNLVTSRQFQAVLAGLVLSWLIG